MGRIFVLLLFVITGSVLLACNSAEQKLRSSTQPTSGAPQGAAPVFADGVRRVTVTELKSLIDNGEAVVVDVRTAEAYNAAHVRGARLIPEAEVGNRANELPKNKLIVTYCA